MTKTKFNKLVIASAVGLAFGAAGAQAQPLFNNNGVGPTVEIKQFNVDTGNYLFNNFAPALLTTTAGSPFEFMGQSRVGNFIQNNGASTQLTAASGFEYTLVMAAPMFGTTTTAADGSVSLTASLNPLVDTVGLTCVKGTACSPAQPAMAANFFEIFYSAANSNISNGTGFTDGALILQGHFVTNFPAPLNAGVQVSKVGPLHDDSSGTTPLALLPLDSTGSIPPNFPTVSSIQIINGSANFNIEIDYSNPIFFPFGPTFINHEFRVTALKPQLTDPNTTVQPSTSYDEVLTVGPLDYGTDTVSQEEAANPDLATADAALLSPPPATNTVNNWHCSDPALPVAVTVVCDFTATGNDSGTFRSTPTPEPGSLALLGLGLGVLGGLGVRRRKLAA